MKSSNKLEASRACFPGPRFLYSAFVRIRCRSLGAPELNSAWHPPQPAASDDVATAGSPLGIRDAKEQYDRRISSSFAVDLHGLLWSSRGEDSVVFREVPSRAQAGPRNAGRFVISAEASRVTNRFAELLGIPKTHIFAWRRLHFRSRIGGAADLRPASA